MKSAVNKSAHEIGGRLHLSVSDDAMFLNQSVAFTDYDAPCLLGAGKVTAIELHPPFARCGLDVSWISSYSDAQRVVYYGTTFLITSVHSDSVPHSIPICIRRHWRTASEWRSTY